MPTIDVLHRKATALAGAPAPGDARATAHVVAQLCDHVSTLQSAVSELIFQIQEAQKEIAELKSRPQ